MKRSSTLNAAVTPIAERLNGTVINVHALGAIVRLDDGELVAAPFADVLAHRSAYLASLERRRPVRFERTSEQDAARRPTLRLVPDDEPSDRAASEPTAAPIVLHDDAFESRMSEYLRSTQEWAPADEAEPADRHFLRKKRRAAQFKP